MPVNEITFHLSSLLKLVAFIQNTSSVGHHYTPDGLLL
ncbi:hypothetical protein ECSTECDG1313_4299 [Escherichia coli STEC_DG131-3]|nr:hypothetical protein ECSTECDG1313_4299 [Escherichia coli STEC_DG131-3]